MYLNPNTSIEDREQILALQERFLNTDFREYIRTVPHVLNVVEADSLISYLLRLVDRGLYVEMPSNLLQEERAMFPEHEDILFYSSSP